MNTPQSSQATIVRTERGLSIAGTRTTLYNVVDYLNAGFPRWLIQDRLNLTEAQMRDVMAYLETHHSEVEREYQDLVQQSEEIRVYWETRNRERLARIASQPTRPGQEAIRAKLRAWKIQQP